MDPDIRRETGLRAFCGLKGLRNATAKERENYTLSPYGIHWEQLDEDLCYEGFFARA